MIAIGDCDDPIRIRPVRFCRLEWAKAGGQAARFVLSFVDVYGPRLIATG